MSCKHISFVMKFTYPIIVLSFVAHFVFIMYELQLPTPDTSHCRDIEERFQRVKCQIIALERHDCPAWYRIASTHDDPDSLRDTWVRLLNIGHMLDMGERVMGAVLGYDLPSRAEWKCASEHLSSPAFFAVLVAVAFGYMGFMQNHFL